MGEKVWKPLDLVKVSAEYLASKDVPNSRLDAEVLLVHTMGLARRVDLYAGFEREVSGKELADYRELIRRRAAREPVSRILGRREFMGIAFHVTPDVLSPRPETELLVEAAIAAANPKKFVEPIVDDALETAVPEDVPVETVSAELERLLDSYAEDAEEDDEGEDAPPKAPASAPPRRAAPPADNAPRPGKKPQPASAGPALRILDLGTGSGCIAVSVAAKLPRARVVAVDASRPALAVASRNARDAGVADRVEFRHGDWFSACRDGEVFDIILSNPPYLIEGDPDIWPEAGRYDPPQSLYGGADGLDAYRVIAPGAAVRLVPGGRIFLEVGAGQAAAVAAMLDAAGFVSTGVTADYGGIGRVVYGVKG